MHDCCIDVHCACESKIENDAKNKKMPRNGNANVKVARVRSCLQESAAKKRSSEMRRGVKE
jgi:hypothetical protein